MASSNCKHLATRDSRHVIHRPAFVAQALIAYVAKSWDIVTLEKPIEASVIMTDDPSGNGTEIELHKVRFNNFAAHYFRNTDGVVIPFELTTTSVNFKLLCGLKIGQSKAEVRKLLGPPSYLQQNSLVYGTGGDQNSEVIFSFTRGRLRQVTWMYDAH